MAAVASIDNPSTTTTTMKDAPSSSSRHHRGATVRLSDRIAELGLCRRDEAERILGETSSTHDDDAPRGTTTTTTTTRRYRNDAKKGAAMTTTRKTKVVYVRGYPIVDGIDARVPPDETDIEIHGGMPVRLSKRMSELGMCSRREAAAMLSDANKYGSGNDDDGGASISISSSLRHLKKVVYLRGRPVLGGAATKVPPGEEYVEIRPGNDPPPQPRRRGGIILGSKEDDRDNIHSLSQSSVDGDHGGYHRIEQARGVRLRTGGASSRSRGPTVESRQYAPVER